MNLSFIKKALPWIGTAIGVAVPGPIGVAAKLLTAGLGKEIKGDAQSVATAVTEALANPDQLAALKKIDNDFALQMATLNFNSIEDLAAIDEKDRESARGREVAVKDKTPRILAYVIMAGFLGMAYGVLFHKMSADSALAGAVIGYLSAKAELVASYYFGSSHGSDAKNEVIANALRKN